MSLIIGRAQELFETLFWRDHSWAVEPSSDPISTVPIPAMFTASTSNFRRPTLIETYTSVPSAILMYTQARGRTHALNFSATHNQRLLQAESPPRLESC